MVFNNIAFIYSILQGLSTSTSCFITQQMVEQNTTNRTEFRTESKLNEHLQNVKHWSKSNFHCFLFYMIKF